MGKEDVKKLEDKELSFDELYEIRGGMTTNNNGFSPMFTSVFAPFFKSIADFLFGGNKKNL